MRRQIQLASLRISSYSPMKGNACFPSLPRMALAYGTRLLLVRTFAYFGRMLSQSYAVEGYEKTTYDYILAHRHATPEPSGISPSRAATPSVDSAAASEAGSEDDEDDDTMKLTFRSAVSKDITLTVRPTTKCSVILKAFLKRAGLSDKYPSSPVKGKKGKSKGSMLLGPALMVDGERLDPDAEISSADLEDGDLVEVTGL